MGIERARVVEVHAPTSRSGRTGSGYLVTERLVLALDDRAGRDGPTHVRQAGTAVWLPASPVWRSPAGGAVLLEVADPQALMVSPGRTRWGHVAGARPVAVTAMGFPPAAGRPKRFRDVVQFLGHLEAEKPAAETPQAEKGGSSGSWPAVVAGAGGAAAGDGMSGAALFAGAELVGVLVAGAEGAGAERLHAVPVAALAAEEAFVGLVAGQEGLALTPVAAPLFGLPLLPAR